ncbi:HlyC/CorC family transporter [Francisella frigiditurris]|uniref:Magnesium and cobalt efflux protein CorC n=1 Tax=Francisella frigiditurris TaxID=1542390 RepID=A0A1J0KT51_9GAMM|nr:transporter associated domain-containing protein [Francisella frigiditurris]APC96875.1 CBS domain protein [Francisella frigiditurris]
MTDNSENTEKKEHKHSFLDKITSSLFNIKTEDDLYLAISKAVKNEVIDIKSEDMILGVMRIASLDVGDIMLSRTKMVTVDLGMSINEILKKVIQSSHTRIPVFADDKEDIIGILHAKDLLKLIFDIEVEDTTSKELDANDIRGILRPAIFIPETKKLNALLKDFKNSQNHIAIVVDEYGAISGLITIEDILEEIVGDIDDEFDTINQAIKKLNEDKFIIDATTSIEEFNEYFGTKIDEEDDFDTVAGMIIQILERLPKKGEYVTVGEFKFTVNDSNNRKIINILVEKIKK